MVMEEKVRIRLAFEDRKVLRKSQRSEGLQCCWMLLRSELQSISDLSSFIISSFKLQKKCPNGLVLSMDDFVLPPLETTNIFKDKDIIRVRKKDGKHRVITSDEANENEDVYFKGYESQFLCKDLLLINQSDNDHGGCQDKKNANCQLIDSNNLAGPSCKAPSLKRKRQSDSEFHTSKNDRFRSCEGYQKNLAVPGEVKKAKSRSARRKKEKRIWLREQAACRKREDCSPRPQIPQDAPACEIVEQSTCSEDDIVPVVVRPGHIRFQALGKSSDVEQGARQIHGDVVMHPREVKACDNSWEENQKESATNRLAANSSEEGAAAHRVDFKNLFPLMCLPKEGDVVAYRLVELSTGCPEFSDFRVGQVSSFDPESMHSILVPVPGYPIATDKVSSYKEDGSLEIDFMSLVDVRLIRNYNSDVATANKSMKACNTQMGQSSTCPWDFKRGSCQNMKAAAATSNGSAGNINAPTSKPWPSNNWDLRLSAISNCGVKVANPASDIKSSLTHVDWPVGWSSSTVWSDDGKKATADHGSENKPSQGRDWDEIKSSHRTETEATSEGWPQWQSREYLANTSWSFLLRGPPPQPSKKRRANGLDAPRRNNRGKG